MPDQDVIRRAIAAWYGLPPDERPPIEEQVDDMRKAIRVVLEDMLAPLDHPDKPYSTGCAWYIRSHARERLGIELEADNAPD